MPLAGLEQPDSSLVLKELSGIYIWSNSRLLTASLVIFEKQQHHQQQCMAMDYQLSQQQQYRD